MWLHSNSLPLCATPRHSPSFLQAELLCAAQHLTWSGMVGGFMWDSGKYDAFETTLEVGAGDFEEAGKGGGGMRKGERGGKCRNWPHSWLPCPHHAGGGGGL